LQRGASYRDAENKRSILDVAPWGGRERACRAVSSADSFVSNLASRCSKEQSHTQEEERRSDHEPRTPRIGAGKMPDAAQAGSIATPVGGLACGALRPAVLMVYDTASMNVPISTIGVDNAAKRGILRGKKRAKNIMGELPDVLDRGRRERKMEEVDDRSRRRRDDLVYSALRGRIPRRRPRRAVLDREPRASGSNRGRLRLRDSLADEHCIHCIHSKETDRRRDPPGGWQS
jgi:hypothetical protein